MTPSHDLVTGLRERGHAALISGAGPTVLVLAHGERAARAAEAAVAELTAGAASAALAEGGTPVAWRVRALRVPTEGAKVESSTQ